MTCATIVQSYLLLITMPMGGLTLGSQPVVSFNYGAANLERIKRAIQSIVALCVTFCVLMTVVTHTLSPVFVGLFTQNPEVAARSVRYIKVFTAMIIPWRSSIPWWTRPPPWAMCGWPCSAPSSASACSWRVCSCCPP